MPHQRKGTTTALAIAPAVAASSTLASVGCIACIAGIAVAASLAALRGAVAQIAGRPVFATSWGYLRAQTTAAQLAAVYAAQACERHSAACTRRGPERQ